MTTSFSSHGQEPIYIEGSIVPEAPRTPEPEQASTALALTPEAVRSVNKEVLEDITQESLRITRLHADLGDGETVNRLFDRADKLFFGVQTAMLEIGYIFYWLQDGSCGTPVYRRLAPGIKNFDEWITATITRRTMLDDRPSLLNLSMIKEAIRLYKLYSRCLNTNVPAQFLLARPLTRERMARIEEQVTLHQNALDDLDDEYRSARNERNLEAKQRLLEEKRTKELEIHQRTQGEIQDILAIDDDQLRREAALAASLPNEMEPYTLQVTVRKRGDQLICQCALPFTKKMFQILKAKRYRHDFRFEGEEDSFTIEEFIQYCIDNRLYVSKPDDDAE